jgi:hypothetical protein
MLGPRPRLHNVIRRVLQNERAFDLYNNNELAFNIAAGLGTIPYIQQSLNSDYEKYKKEKEEREARAYIDPAYAKIERYRIKKDIDFIMNSPIADNPILNPRYDFLINRLNKINLSLIHI